ncbi:DUF551 domain-containing protein [Lewinella sp. W8]|uniref:DUF551 domain-containing protein n=1 Tax=Lewinella sp. W8 TaxID=2528208 RepID=UPI001067B341|nr:DUF551 domain-containing protein [Lewinella sp. W8]MTB53053.1 DUF551 domain-containing protein [Lewinella sp. W8]
MRDLLLKIITEIRHDRNTATNDRPFPSDADLRLALAAIEDKLNDCAPWVSVEDAFPCDLEFVVMVTKDRYWGIAKYHADAKVFVGNDFQFENNYITHWMPLPKPPTKNP